MTVDAKSSISRQIAGQRLDCNNTERNARLQGVELRPRLYSRSAPPDPQEASEIERFIAERGVAKCPAPEIAPRLCDGCRQFLPPERFYSSDGICKRCRRDPIKKAGGKISAAIRGAPLVKSVSPMDIFLRDGWICGICGEPIDGGLEHPDPMSASLDHILAIALGGEHTCGNLQAAHLSCNFKKGNKPGLRKRPKKSRYSGNRLVG